MTVFRTPAISFLSRYASSPNLPRAASVLTLLAAGVAALRPVSRDFLLSLGPVLCFGVASLVSLGSCAAVWLIDRAIPLAEPASAGESPRLFGAIVTLFASGAGLALAQFALLTQLLPRMLGMLPSGLPELSALTAAAMLYFGACALGAGAMARRLGNERTMLIGAGASTALIAFLAYVSPTPALLVGLIALTLASFSLVANGMIPLALGRVSTDRGGLGLGFYFGGLSATSSVVAFRFRPPVSVGEATTFALIGLALVASAVWAGRQPPTGRQATTRP